MELTIDLSGEIHSDWHDQITRGIAARNLPVQVLSPVTEHAAESPEQLIQILEYVTLQ